MPPKSARPATQPEDGWSSNPYRATDPRYNEFEGQRQSSQREAIVGRVGKDRAKQMRVSDFAQHSMTNSGIAAAVAAAPPGSGGQTTRRLAAIQDDACSAKKLKFPSLLREPTSHLERTIPVEGVVCSLAVQGGALVWCFCDDGRVQVVSGFTGDDVASFTAQEDIEAIDDELASHHDYSRKEAHADRIKGLPRKKVPERHTKSNKVESEDKGAFVITASFLGESQLIAALRSDGVVRVYNVITMEAILDVDVKLPRSDEQAAAATTTDNTTTTNNGDVAEAKKEEEGSAKGDAPFGAVLLIESLGGSVLFCVVQEDSACVVRLTNCNDPSTRPTVEVLRRRSYDRLNLKFTAACTDDIRTLVYACDSKGQLWWIDIEDLLVVDSLVIVPNETGSKTPSKKSKKAADNTDAPSEFGTSVAVYKHWVVTGTDKGTLVVFATQSLGEKPHVQIRQKMDEAGIVGITPDERTGSVWVAFSNGRLASWILKTHELAYSVRPPIDGVARGCTMLPHTITNKIWTATTSGINHVFITETNLPLEQMLGTQTLMGDALNHQKEAVAIKDGEVCATEETIAARLAKIVDSFETTSMAITLRQYYYKWLNYKVRVVARRNREATADCLAGLSDLELGRLAFLRLIKHMNINRAKKQVGSMVNLLTQRSEELLSRRYYTYLQEIIKARKIASANEAKCKALLNVTENAIRASVLFNQLSRYSSMRLAERERVRYAVHQAKVYAARIVGSYFNKWFKFRAIAVQRTRAVSISDRLVTTTETATRAHYYSRLALLSKMRAKDAQRTKWVENFSAAMESQRRLAYYTTWRTFRSTKFAEKKAEELSGLESQKASLNVAYAEVAPKADRKKQIAANKERIEELKRQIAEAKNNQSTLNSSCATLAAESVAAANEATKDSSAAGRLQLLNAMSGLRGAAFQFHKDGPAITKFADKAKKAPATAFTAAWGELRTTVEDFIAGKEPVKKTTKPVPAAAASTAVPVEEQQQPVTEEAPPKPPVEWAMGGSASEYFVKVSKAPIAHINLLLEGARKAVIAFDLLGGYELEQLEQREEILHNIASLESLVDAAMLAKTKAAAASAGAM